MVYLESRLLKSKKLYKLKIRRRCVSLSRRFRKKKRRSKRGQRMKREELSRKRILKKKKNSNC